MYNIIKGRSKKLVSVTQGILGQMEGPIKYFLGKTFKGKGRNRFLKNKRPSISQRVGFCSKKEQPGEQHQQKKRERNLFQREKSKQGIQKKKK